MKIGLIVNPIAGMGGTVGLKGTDGGAYEKAVSLGAVPGSHIAAMRAMYLIRGDHTFVSAELMGSGALSDIGIEHEKIPLSGERTTASDTKDVAAMMKNSCDLILFCGGDGTARDIFDAVGNNVPVLGIPAGVKMYSSVFAATPEDVHTVVEAFASGSAKIIEREVMDIDEDDYGNGVLSARLYGYLSVPFIPSVVQSCKGIYIGNNEKEEIDEVAEYVISTMKDDVLYLIGAGSTTGRISERLGLGYTLLGIDAVFNKRTVAMNLCEKEIIALTENYENVVLILGVIGKQGFFLGRGNKELSPAVIRRIGIDNIVLVSSVTKLNDLKELHIDTGDPQLDAELKGFRKVVCRYGRERVLRVV